MAPDQTRAILTLALMAAFADGLKDERERSRVKEIASRLPAEGIDLAAIYQDVLLGRPALADVAKTLAGDAHAAQFAYEMAVGVIDADGAHTPTEGAFLDELAAALKLPATEAHAYVAQADAIAAAPGVPATQGSPEASLAAAKRPDEAALDERIVNASITNAALELLPESLASMAILPLQMRLVYRIGQAHGYDLDHGHVKELVATLGIGLAGQYLEQFVRRLLGGVMGAVLGGIGRTIGKQAASSGTAFATTWALGQLAKQYYGRGRTLDAAGLKQAFSGLVGEGQRLVAQYGPAIEARARTIDVKRLPQLIGQV